MSTPDLFDPSAAWNRAEAGMHRAADRIERLTPGWKRDALEAVRRYASEHETFLAEDVRAFYAQDVEGDMRGWGAVMQQAKQHRLCRPDGTQLDRWGSHKTRWRSLIFTGGLAP